MIMQGRLKHIMIRLTQIKKDKNNISCLALVEDCTIPFKLIYDIMSEEFQPYELPKSYEYCKSHIAHARRELERISKEEILPQERLIMWY